MIKKILILRFSSIGDIVLTTPVIRCIKEQTQSEVHFLTKKAFKSILENNPFIDRLWTFDQSTDEVVSELRREKFDFVVDLHNNIRTWKLKSKIGSPSSSFPKLNVQKWLYVNLKWNILPDVHVVDRYFEAARSLGVTNDSLGLNYFISEQDELIIKDVLPMNFQQGYAVFTLGAQFKTKCLPEFKILELLGKILIPVVLLGGEDDVQLGQKLEANFQGRVLNQAGKLSLGQSASIIQQANVVIAHDTGLMHIAASFHKPIAVIWGNTTPKIGMSPYQTRAESEFFEVGNLKCRPCSKIGFQTCPKVHFKCMTEQNTDAIAQFANRFELKH